MCCQCELCPGQRSIMDKVGVISCLCIYTAIIYIYLRGSKIYWDYTIPIDQENYKLFSVDNSSKATKHNEVKVTEKQEHLLHDYQQPDDMPNKEILHKAVQANTDDESAVTMDRLPTGAPRGGHGARILTADHLLELVDSTARAVSQMRFISDKTFPANFSLQFLPEYKTPCWQENSSLWCLPYFFIAGFPKCGTTELFEKLLAHPEICQGRYKEPHWWTRGRYGRKSSFGFYKSFFKHRISDVRKTVVNRGFHRLVLTEASASTLWDNAELYSLNSNYEDPTYLNIHAVHSVLPQAKFVVILRNPVSRLYSDYLFFQRVVSPEDFHDQVKQAISLFQDCLQNPAKSFLYCVYSKEPTNCKLFRRLRIALYYVHLRLLLCVYPRSNVFILQLEDYIQDEVRWLRDIMNFLDVSDMPVKDIVATVQQSKPANSNKKKYGKVGPMLNETLTMLEEFYRPFNILLANFLGDKYIKY